MNENKAPLDSIREGRNELKVLFRTVYLHLPTEKQLFDIMRKIVLISFVILSAAVQMTHAQKQAVIKLTETTLMHEMRATPYPLIKRW